MLDAAASLTLSSVLTPSPDLSSAAAFPRLFERNVHVYSTEPGVMLVPPLSTAPSHLLREISWRQAYAQRVTTERLARIRLAQMQDWTKSERVLVELLSEVRL